MAVLAKKTLEQIESHIRVCANQIHKNGLEIGQGLIEIRDNEMWKGGAGYNSWDQYLKAMAQDLIGQTPQNALLLMRSVQVKNAISNIDVTDGLGSTHLIQIGRLAPNVGRGRDSGVEKNYSAIKDVDVRRVIESAKEKGDGKVSVRSLKAAVDADIGVDKQRKADRERAKKEKEERKRMQGEWNELSNVLDRMNRDLQRLLRDLVKVSPEGWTLLADHRPKAAKSLAETCEELAGLLRS